MKPRPDLDQLPPIARANAMHTRLPVNVLPRLVGFVLALLIAAGLGYALVWPDAPEDARPAPVAAAAESERSAITYLTVEPPTRREAPKDPAAP